MLEMRFPSLMIYKAAAPTFPTIADLGSPFDGSAALTAKPSAPIYKGKKVERRGGNINTTPL